MTKDIPAPGLGTTEEEGTTTEEDEDETTTEETIIEGGDLIRDDVRGGTMTTTTIEIREMGVGGTPGGTPGGTRRGLETERRGTEAVDETEERSPRGGRPTTEDRRAETNVVRSSPL